MGEVDVILDIRISKTYDNYIETILKKFNVYDDGLVKTPIDLLIHLVKNNSEPISQLEYFCIIGSLMYVMNCMRPNITFVTKYPPAYTLLSVYIFMYILLKIFHLCGRLLEIVGQNYF